jgi:uncharacterized protein YegP (UPF0339 family)
MATATKHARAGHQAARNAGAPFKEASMEFVVFEDNGGGYHWRIIAGNGGTLAESVSFASFEDAEQAARRVRDGVGSASFEPRAGGDQRIDLAARHATAK